MCGIAGVFDPGGLRANLSTVLEQMGRALIHRGPDERAVWVDGCVGLAARRLRVVDLFTGQQPLVSEDGHVRLVANGEIYNADELRDDLTRRGHRFTSRTDTETILHLYEEEGTACLDRVEGMFAFGLWDAHRRRLMLARDRFGEKPLYYTRVGNALLFASELKALIVHPGVSRDIDRTALARYLMCEYVPSPRTIFQAVRKLPAGHFLLLGADGSEKLERYWSPPAMQARPPSRHEAADTVLDLLDDSVRRRVGSCDVPWGTFLSGGLDSSMITALAAARSSRPIKTFAIGFEESTYDERGVAALVARALGTDHRETVLTAGNALRLLPEVARIFDEPFADPSAIPAVLLSRLAREHVTVVLSGDGADELFCGYPTHRAHLVAELYKHTPPSLHRAIVAVAERLPTSHRYLSFDFALRRFLLDARRPALERHMRWMGSFTPESIARLVSPAMRAQEQTTRPYDEAADRIRTGRSMSANEVALALDVAFYLADDNLVQDDRASMSIALEVRAPFLDRSLSEYALSLPVRSRMGLWTSKPLLRRAARGLVPPRVVRRGKHGFGVPIGTWLRGALGDLARDMLSPDRLRRQGIFDASFVGTLLDRHQTGIANHRKELWTLLMFQLWTEAYGIA